MKDYKYSLDIIKQELNSRWTCPELKYAYKASAEALEKQIAKNVIKTEKVSQACPSCRKNVNGKYCSNCGQKLRY